MNLALGFLAILIGDLYISSLLIFSCVFLDVFDGSLARALNAQSAIGKELDSLADLVSFGIAPAYLYSLIATGDHWMYYFPPIIFLVSGALRLAIFNTLPANQYFKGLAIPASASVLIGISVAIYYQSEFMISMMSNYYIYLGVSLFLAFMMLSKFEMFSAKTLKYGLAKNPFQILSVVIFIILLLTIPTHALWLNVISYIILSILENIFRINSSNSLNTSK